MDSRERVARFLCFFVVALVGKSRKDQKKSRAGRRSMSSSSSVVDEEGFQSKITDPIDSHEEQLDFCVFALCSCKKRAGSCK